MTWATRITILRLILIPVFVVCIVSYGQTDGAGHPDEAWRYAAIGVFLVASLSDALDGYLARHWNQRSALGALLDPIADKLLLLAALITLALNHLWSFPIWFPAIIISRDALLMGGYAVLRHFHIPVEVHPHWTGKLSTVFTLLAIGAGLCKLGDTIIVGLCAAGAGLALVCTVIYVREGLALLTHGGHTTAQATPNKRN